MSALPMKVDILERSRNVRFGWWSQPVDATLYLGGKKKCIAMVQRFRRGFSAAEKDGVVGSLAERGSR